MYNGFMQGKIKHRKGGGMYMKIKKPDELKSVLAKKHGWLTQEEIAAGTGLSLRTVTRIMNGNAVRATTIKKLAEAAEREPMSIAEFV